MFAAKMKPRLISPEEYLQQEETATERHVLLTTIYLPEGESICSLPNLKPSSYPPFQLPAASSIYNPIDRAISSSRRVSLCRSPMAR